MAQTAAAAAAGTEKAQAQAQTAIATDEDPTRGMPYHDKLTAELKQAIMRKRILERNITAMDEAIYKKEGEYLEDTPHGNVLTGFENYIKGVTSSAVGRRKQGVSENDRVFSRSSMRLSDFLDSPGGLSTQTTPSGAPTPISAGFGKDREGSGNATPTNGTARAAVKKKRGKGEGEDSEMEERDGKKARGGVRK